MKYWMNKRVLVTGCTGLVGSWLTRRLVEEGADVVGLIRDMVPYSNLNLSEFDADVVTVRGDLIDYELLLRILNEYEIDTVFHLAAQTIVTIANRAPLSTFDANIRGTWNLLEAARATPTLRRFVLASSDKAYGAQEDLPYREGAPLIGKHPYDVSKSCADLLAQTYFHTYDMPVGISRCGNIFGGGDLNFNRVIPETMAAAYEGRPPVIRSDGTPTRDYLYVVDVADAYMCLAEGLDDPKIAGEAFNFSYEQPQTVAEVVTRTLKVLGRDDLEPEIRGEGMPRGEIPHQYLAADKARDMLNWRPRYGIDEGLKLTYDWYREFFAGRERRRQAR
ncbi:MAG: NAD-dependent epimerase/dehydratase family protein [Gammaproteobacteria bacterium]|nr:GDP-mannose 4,6-dehydratase [Gammaproteobacteria bacterium]NNL99308.1 NAD-dependent epimerase/dehydratase family protein [Gammaproteobacteria bacterium]